MISKEFILLLSFTLTIYYGRSVPPVCCEGLLVATSRKLRSALRKVAPNNSGVDNLRNDITEMLRCARVEEVR